MEKDSNAGEGGGECPRKLKRHFMVSVRDHCLMSRASPCASFHPGNILADVTKCMVKQSVFYAVQFTTPLKVFS